MEKVCWPYYDPDFDNMSERINGPSCRVCIDNESLEDSTAIKVDSVNKQDLLLKTVQVIADLNLNITKGYISSDAGWVMDGLIAVLWFENISLLRSGEIEANPYAPIYVVFHVKDENGNKLTDPTVLDNIQQAIGSGRASSLSPIVRPSTSKAIGSEHTVIEMIAADRPGLFSEISAALADLHCNIVEAHAWSHNARLACVAYVSDQSSSTSIEDPLRLATIEEHLTTVLRAKSALADIDMKQKEVKTSDFIRGDERRLHQLMVSMRDFDFPPSEPSTSPRSPLERMGEEGTRTIVYIESCSQKGYSIEYFIRHRDGTPLHTQSEKDRVIKCLEAAIERRVCEGIKLELCANNRAGLLSDITRLLRENGLAVVRADIATQGEKAVDAFYVRDVTGKNADMEVVESVKKEMSPIYLQVKNESKPRPNSPERYHFSLAGMLKSHIARFSHNLLL